MKSFPAHAVLLLSSLFPVVAFKVQAQQGSDSAVPVLRTTVRRVIVDVVVTDRTGKPVAGLKREDFKIFEDNGQQQVLSFDTFGFSAKMDYVPAKLPVMPAKTFVNLPAAPEKGPLYVLLYDLVNVEKNEDQIFARKELVKFIQDKPEGTRFAIFMLSDGLHLVQGFTSDKDLLFAAIDPARSHAHVPKIFMMGKNFGQDDPGTALLTMKYLANYLNGLQGRKNVLWVSGNFPLTLFPKDDDNPDFIDEVKKTLDLLARSQIAIYPVDVRGVSVENPHAPAGSTGGGGISSDSREHSTGGSNTPAPGSATAAGSISPGAGGIGYNTLSSSYMTADEVARITGGRAFYSTNDVKLALTEATADGASYYTLSYAPNNREYDGKLHNIRVELAQRGYSLAYRRAYYGLDPNAASMPAGKGVAVSFPEQTPERKKGDSLAANMQHGAPMVHDLVFGAHVEAVGAPGTGTPQQMAQFADQPAFFRTRKRNATVKLLAPIVLQKYRVQYSVMASQLKLAGGPAVPNLEVAIAAYDEEGIMLNAVVNVATGVESSAAAQSRSYQAEQAIFVPVNAATLRMAVRDRNTDRIGAMEIKLPLQLDPQTQAASHAVTTPR